MTNPKLRAKAQLAIVCSKAEAFELSQVTVSMAGSQGWEAAGAGQLRGREAAACVQLNTNLAQKTHFGILAILSQFRFWPSKGAEMKKGGGLGGQGACCKGAGRLRGQGS